jgi:hypothetical protein
METFDNKITDEFLCKKCNKQYKNKSGLWKHNTKYHNKEDKSNLSQNSCINKTDKSNLSPISAVTIHTETGTQNVQIKGKYKCKYCPKIFKHLQSRWKHEKICKTKNNYNHELNELKKEHAELKQQFSEFLKYAKIHPKTLEKINKNLVTGNNNSNNNNTINNIQIVKFGSEDIQSILNEKEIKNILNRKFLAIEESIKQVHFNDNRPEYRNIYITNLRDDIAYIYNGNKFEAVQKHSVISELIDQHMNNIEVSLEDYKDKLPEKTACILDKLLEKLQDEETKITDECNNKEYKNYKLYKINEIKLMIYNETCKNTEVIKFKYNNKKQKEIEIDV